MEGEGEIRMRDLCLDWWEMGPNELDALVKGCTGLARIQVGITFALVKLVSPPCFGNVPCQTSFLPLS
jgi:hypothetical protein